MKKFLLSAKNLQFFLWTWFIVFVLFIFYDICYVNGWYIAYSSNKKIPELVHSFMVNAHGLLLDLLIFGILVAIYDYQRERKNEIERNKNLIDDFRHWKSEEAMFRICGAIRRLNELGEYDLDLRGCFLEGAVLHGVILNKAKLWKTNFRAAKMRYAKLNGAEISGADFSGADLMGADFSNAIFYGADSWEISFPGIGSKVLGGSDLPTEKIGDAVFENTVMRGVKLSGAKVGQGWFEKSEKWKVMRLEPFRKDHVIDEASIIHKL